MGRARNIYMSSRICKPTQFANWRLSLQTRPKSSSLQTVRFERISLQTHERSCYCICRLTEFANSTLSLQIVPRVRSRNLQTAEFANWGAYFANWVSSLDLYRPTAGGRLRMSSRRVYATKVFKAAALVRDDERAVKRCWCLLCLPFLRSRA